MDTKRHHQLVASAVTLDHHRIAGTLDEAGFAQLNQIREELAALSGRSVVEALLSWVAQGSHRFDPRPARITVIPDDLRPTLVEGMLRRK
jgi:hypothetical protein